MARRREAALRGKISSAIISTEVRFAETRLPMSRKTGLNMVNIYRTWKKSQGQDIMLNGKKFPEVSPYFASSLI